MDIYRTGPGKDLTKQKCLLGLWTHCGLSWETKEGKYLTHRPSAHTGRAHRTEHIVLGWGPRVPAAAPAARSLVFVLDGLGSQVVVIDPLLGQVRPRTDAFPFCFKNCSSRGEILSVFTLSCLHFQFFWQEVKLLSEGSASSKSSSWRKNCKQNGRQRKLRHFSGVTSARKAQAGSAPGRGPAPREHSAPPPLRKNARQAGRQAISQFVIHRPNTND